MNDYLHLLPFFSWIPLALLAGSQLGRRRAARVLWTITGGTFLLCGYMLYLDFVWSRHVVAPIRVDLLLLIPLTTVTFIGVGLWGLLKPGGAAKIASVLLLALSLPTLVDFTQDMRRSGVEIARMNTRPALLFEAQFRNARTFENFFGSLDTVRDPRAGHYRSDDPNGLTSRVIINDRGQFWLMIKCEATVECVYARADLGATPLPATIKAAGVTGAPEDITVSAWSPDRLTLKFWMRGGHTFVRAPVPFREQVPVQAAVAYHGSWSSARVDRNYVELVQVWLWQSGDRWLAYYTRRNAQCGSTNDFIFPLPFAGAPVADLIAFDRAPAEHPLERFEIRQPSPRDDRIEGQIYYNGAPLRSFTLAKPSILRSPSYDSAPLTSLEVTAEWLKTISMGDTMSWKADCGGA